MSFQQGLAGLNAASKSLEVIGNNVANSGTFGAKSSRAEFASVYAAAANGMTTGNIGIGVLASAGNAAEVWLPHRAHSQVCARCSVTSSGAGSGRSNI